MMRHNLIVITLCFGLFLILSTHATAQRQMENLTRGIVAVKQPGGVYIGWRLFGTDPESSVLDPECRAHEVENLYVTDGSFMPTGGSVPHTWTIYANAFRVADRIVNRLGGSKGEVAAGLIGSGRRTARA